MKLKRLRQQLRKDRPQVEVKPKLRERKHPRRLRCNKCRGPREPASLTDPDVAEIVREHPASPPEAAFRCRPCGIIWLVNTLIKLECVACKRSFEVQKTPTPKGAVFCTECAREAGLA